MKGGNHMTMLKCLICDLQVRAAGSLYCRNCGAKIKAGRTRRSGGQPSTFLVYNDNVVALIPNGRKDADGCELFESVLLKRKPEGLPKAKTINLNAYCEGYSREQIKKLKAAVKQATG